MLVTTPATRLLVTQRSSSWIPVVAQVEEQRRVAGGRDARAHSLGAQLERGPHRFRPHALPGVGCQPQPRAPGERETLPNHSAGPRSSLPPMSKATTPSFTARPPGAPPPSRVPRPIGARCSKIQRTSMPDSRAASRNRFVDWRELLLLPEHHAGGEWLILGIADVLAGQGSRAGAAGDQGVGGRGAEPLHDGPDNEEGFEALVAVEGADLFLLGRGVEFVQGFRLHRAFQVKGAARLWASALG